MQHISDEKPEALTRIPVGCLPLNLSVEGAGNNNTSRHTCTNGGRHGDAEDSEDKSLKA